MPWQTFGSMRAYMIQAALASAGKGEEGVWDCVYRFLAVVDAGVEAAGAVMRPAHTRALDNISASESMPGNGYSLSQWGQVCNMFATLQSTEVSEVFFLVFLFSRQSLPRKHSGLDCFFTGTSSLIMPCPVPPLEMRFPRYKVSGSPWIPGG